MSSANQDPEREKLIRKVVEELKAARLHLQSLEAQVKIDDQALKAAKAALESSEDLNGIMAKRIELLEQTLKLREDQMTLAKSEIERLIKREAELIKERDRYKTQRNVAAVVIAVLLLFGALSRD